MPTNLKKMSRFVSTIIINQAMFQYWPISYHESAHKMITTSFLKPTPGLFCMLLSHVHFWDGQMIKYVSQRHSLNNSFIYKFIYSFIYISIQQHILSSLISLYVIRISILFYLFPITNSNIEVFGMA